VNRSRLALLRTQLVTDGGPPWCPACGGRLHFDSDRNGRTTQSCDCGYDEYVVTRQEPTAPVSAPRAPSQST